MKIPTLLVLVILSLLIIVGLGLKSFLNFPLPKTLTPDSIILSNLSPNSVTIIWFTESIQPTKLIYTTDKNFFKDLKSVSDDVQNNQTSHFLDLQELQPNTTYYFKIGEPFLLNPSNEFTTPPEDNLQDPKIQPLVGSVVNNNLQPVSNVLVTLEVQGFLPLATVTSSSGNFVLPVKPMYNQNNLRQTADFNKNPDVLLVLKNDNQTSRIDLRLDRSLGVLPSIVLGENLDLRDYQATSSADVQGISIEYSFDVNSDGKINTIDVVTVQNNVDKKKFNLKTDINQDGKVDQTDLEQIKQALN